MKSANRLRPYKTWLVALGASALLTAACGADTPAAPVAGAEKCAQCAMMIHDLRFHSQGFNEHGKPRHFDSIECAAAYKAAGKETLRAIYAADFLRPKTYLALVNGAGEPAQLLQSVKIRSPMGAGLAAVRAVDAAPLMKKFAAQRVEFASVAHKPPTAPSMP